MINVKFGNIRSKRKSILLIDSDEIIHSMLKTRLTHAGYKVDCARSGDEARASLKKIVPDLILMDNNTPGADGFSLLKAVKESKALKKVPVFLLANGSEIETIERALNLGAINYIVKPVDPSVLMDKINKKFLKK
ncbi:MAG: response regulator [bacterium]